MKNYAPVTLEDGDLANWEHSVTNPDVRKIKTHTNIQNKSTKTTQQNTIYGIQVYT